VKHDDTLAITSHFGDPRNPKVWTGVPKLIVEAFERQHCKVVGIDASLNKVLKVPILLAHLMSGLGRMTLDRGRLARTRSAKIVTTQCQAHQIRKVLHLGTCDLPAPQHDNHLEHYLTCDSTWNLWSQTVTNIDRYTSQMVKLAEQLEQEAYAQIQHFFPWSDYVRDNLINNYGIDPSRISVIGSGRGSSIQPFHGSKNYESGHILFVAKDRFEDKGGYLLLEAFQIAQRKNPNLKLLIVGRVSQKSFEQIPNVTTYGYLPGDELQQLFNTAALFAMPAINEPWGLVYLEALCCKTPVLGLNRNALPEFTHQGAHGFLVDKPDAKDIAEAILAAFANPARLAEMGLQGQQYVTQKYSWEAAIETMKQTIFPSTSPDLRLP
jgi:glycosyltransferase involved in cell wall biosynthesis